MGSHSSYRDRKGSSRKGSSDSYRSQRSHRDRSRSYDSYRSRDRDRDYTYDDYDDYDDRRRGPKRKETGSSSRSSSARDRDDRPTKSQPFGGLLATLHEEPGTLDAKRGSTGSSPPTYDQSQSQAQVIDDKTPDPEKGETKHELKKNKNKNKQTLRSWWSLAPVIPLLTGIFLLFIITASSSDLRADFGVIKVELSAGDYSALYSATLSSVKGDSANSTVAAQSMDADGGGLMERDETGYLTLGIWGWCVRNDDSSQTACSHTSGWYDLNDLFGGVSTGLKASDFNSFLIHLLILHGIAFLVGLLAMVPVGLSAWRQHHKKDAESRPGWFQHGTLLTAAALALVAWVDDEILAHTISSHATGYTVQTGLGSGFVGGATLALFTAFFFSTVPLMCQFIRHRHQWAASHSDLLNAMDLEEEERARMEAEEMVKEGERKKKREERRERERERDRQRRARRGGRRRGWRNRMTRAFGYYDDDRDDDGDYLRRRRR